MSEIIRGNAKVMAELEPLCPGSGAIRHSEDAFGNAFHWYVLERPAQILEAAEIMKKAGARLAIIAAYDRKGEGPGPFHSACYEFVLDGTVYGITVNMDAEHPSAPSISRIFANADWHEREMMELYDIKVSDHPNPKRLFLDEQLEQGVLGKMVPLSIMMNGSTSNDLWEAVLSDRGEKK